MVHYKTNDLVTVETEEGQVAAKIVRDRVGTDMRVKVQYRNNAEELVTRWVNVSVVEPLTLDRVFKEMEEMGL